MSNRPNAMSARAADISLRQRISCSTEDTSDQSSAGALNLASEELEAVGGETCLDRRAGVEDNHRSARLRANGARHGRCRASAHRSPSCARQSAGASRPAASAAEIRLLNRGGPCVPARRDRRRPDRIQRRTVSGLQRTRRAASGTVSIGVAYYNSVLPLAPHAASRRPTAPTATPMPMPMLMLRALCVHLLGGSAGIPIVFFADSALNVIA